MSDSPQVIIVMGSRSDLEVMQETAKMLDRFGVSSETRVVSAHRTPARACELASTAQQRGVKCIIAAAGKAAHLAGVLAAHTTVPMIGVPMTTSDLGGMDSLLSMVQMPRGVPVATVAIGKTGAVNAALLAVSILALADEALSGKLQAYRQEMAEAVEKDDEEIRGR